MNDRQIDVLVRALNADGTWQASRELKSLARSLERKGLLKSAGIGAGGVFKYRITPLGKQALLAVQQSRFQ